MRTLKAFSQSWWFVGTLALLIGGAATYEIQRHHRSAIAKQPKQPVEEKLKPGMVLPVLTGNLVGGGKQSIDLSGKTTLYVFSPACHWCERNEDNAKVLAQVPGRRFIGISNMDYGMRDYIAEHKVQYPIYVKLDKRLEIRTTPTTIFADDGVITGVVAGAYVPENEVKIKQYLPGLALPGLKPE